MNEKPQLPPPRPPNPSNVRKQYKQLEQDQQHTQLRNIGFEVFYRFGTGLSKLSLTSGHWLSDLWRFLRSFHNWKQLTAQERRGEERQFIKYCKDKLPAWGLGVNISHPAHCNAINIIPDNWFYLTRARFIWGFHQFSSQFSWRCCFNSLQRKMRLIIK